MTALVRDMKSEGLLESGTLAAAAQVVVDCLTTASGDTTGGMDPPAIPSWPALKQPFKASCHAFTIL